MLREGWIQFQRRLTQYNFGIFLPINLLWEGWLIRNYWNCIDQKKPVTKSFDFSKTVKLISPTKSLNYYIVFNCIFLFTINLPLFFLTFSVKTKVTKMKSDQWQLQIEIKGKRSRFSDKKLATKSTQNY